MTGNEWDLLQKVTRDGRPIHIAGARVAMSVVAGPEIICPICRGTLDLTPDLLARSTARKAPGATRDMQSIEVRLVCPRATCGAQVVLTIELSPGEFEQTM